MGGSWERHHAGASIPSTTTRFRPGRTEGRKGVFCPCAHSRVGFDATGNGSEARSPEPWPGYATRLGGIYTISITLSSRELDPLAFSAEGEAASRTQ